MRRLSASVMLWNGRGSWKLRASPRCVRSMRGEPVDRLAVEVHRAGLVLQRAADAIDQRALARAVRPDQAEPLARLHLEVDAVERDEAAEALADIVDVQQRAHGCPPRAQAFLHQPDQAVGRDDDEADQQQADDQQVDRRGDGHGGDLLQRAEQDGADQRPDPAGGAADHRHGDRVDRVFEAEGRRPAADSRCNRGTARRPCP